MLCWVLASAALSACLDPDEREPATESKTWVARPSVVKVAAAQWGPCGCPSRGPASAEVAAWLAQGPLLGAITDRSVNVWVRSEKARRFVVRMTPVEQPELPSCTAAVPFEPDADYTGVVALDALTPSTSYTYTIELVTKDGDCGRTASRPATFHTLSEAGKPSHVRFAVGADVRGSDVPGFQDIARVSPDFVLMIGDNVYADDDGGVRGDFDATYKRFQRLYRHVWGGRQFRALFSSTPVFMMWDDHEIMENYWAGKDELRYAVARSLFDSYQANHNPSPLRPGELYYSFHAGDVGFFMLDVRTHRDGNEAKARLDPSKTMLGAAQRDALLYWLANDPSRVHVVVSPVIVSDFRTTGADAWRAFDAERRAMLDAIAANPRVTTFIISGDQHWSAVLRIEHKGDAPYTIYEYQTTPLGAGTRPAPERIDERVLALDNGHRVFGVFDIDTRAEPPTLDFTICAVGAPCAPHGEPAPRSTGPHSAVLPYSAHFIATSRGFALTPEGSGLGSPVPQ